MKAKYLGFLLVTMALIIGCSEEEIANIEQVEQSVEVKVQAYSGSGNEPVSRLAYTDSKVEGEGVTVTWSAEDAFFLKGEMDESNSYTYGVMKIVEKDTYGKMEEFKGTLNRILQKGENVTGYYPSSAYDEANFCFNVDVRKATQQKNTPMAHLSSMNYMVGKGVVNDDGLVTIDYAGGNKVAIVRFDMTLPENVPSGVIISDFLIESQNLHTIGTLSTEDDSFSENSFLERHRQKVCLDGYTTSDKKLSVYIAMLPTTLNKDMTVKLTLANGNVYSTTVGFSDADVKACNRYYIVKNLETLIELDYEWYTSLGNSADSYEIKTESELLAFANIVNGTAPNGIAKDDFAGQTIILMNDIVLNTSWIPVGNSNNTGYNSNYFKGTFDGNSYTISQLNLDVEAPVLSNGRYAHGFFGNTDGATIRNLTLSGQGLMYRTSGTSAGGYYLGGFVGEAKDTNFENCRNEINLMGYRFYGLRFGGFVGQLSGGSVKVCSNAGNLSTEFVSEVYAGGIIGIAERGTSLSMIACYTEDVIISASNAVNISILGGLIGEHSGKTVLVASYSLVDEIITDSSSHTNSYMGALAAYIGSKGWSYSANAYGCYSIINLFGYKWLTQASQNTESCLNVGADKNSETYMLSLNSGIAAWNATLSGILDPNYCSYAYKLGDTHLILEKLKDENTGQVEDMGDGGEIGK